MKRLFLKLFAAVLLSLLPSLASGQAKVYTKRVLLEDFPTSTVKVVLSSESPLELAVKGEISSRWRVSPFEFCTVQEYEKLKTDNSFYFLRLVTMDGVAFLSLDKGGKEEDPDRAKRPLDVVMLPISLDGMMTGDEAIYMGAFLDIIQDFTLDAMKSDRVGYAGLSGYNLQSLQGKTIYLDGAMANEAFGKEEENAVVPVLIVPVNGSTYYKMLISADTHELCYFAKGKVKEKTKEGFTKAELKMFESRRANIVG